MTTRIKIKGREKLSGNVTVSTAKNALLPILAATIMVDGQSTFTKVPRLGDVSSMIRMLNELGLWTELRDGQLKVFNQYKVKHIAPYELVVAMRASFFVAGPILAKTGFAKVALPGGCSIGARPVGIHLEGFEALGAKTRIEHGFVEMKSKQLYGAHIPLSFPSVGATENIMMAACLAKGKTVITNAAREPEVEDLARFLNRAGAKITGEGTETITVEGVEGLKGDPAPYQVISDRIEACTLLIAAAITKGDLWVHNVRPNDIKVILDKLREMGLSVEVKQDSIRVKYVKPLKPVHFKTEPYPGFPTDVQAQMMSLMTVIEGDSVIEEAIFENRFMHANELVRMGADITLEKQKALIKGVDNLSGSEVKIKDLRGGAALMLSGLAAEGETILYGLHHLERGYDNLPKKLAEVGAKIYN